LNEFCFNNASYRRYQAAWLFRDKKAYKTACETRRRTTNCLTNGNRLWVMRGQCLVFGALFTSWSGPIHKHIVKHIETLNAPHSLFAWSTVTLCIKTTNYPLPTEKIPHILECSALPVRIPSTLAPTASHQDESTNKLRPIATKIRYIPSSHMPNRQ